jgi:hypothetical protein
MTKNEEEFETRLQIACHNTLVLDEVYPDYFTAVKAWHEYCHVHHANNLPLGGSIIKRADLPRVWNVKVGEEIS